MFSSGLSKARKPVVTVLTRPRIHPRNDTFCSNLMHYSLVIKDKNDGRDGQPASMACNAALIFTFFTALQLCIRGLAMSLCPSVCLSLRLSNA